MKNIPDSKYFNGQYLVPTSRLANWDYSSPGYYFITVCTKDRTESLGKVEGGKWIPTEIGAICKKYWQEIPSHYPNTKLHSFCIMPNHIHGIIQITKQDSICRDVACNVSTNKNHSNISPISGSLPSAIRSYKYSVKKYSNQHNINFFWQTRYHDHIIKSQQEFMAISKYIEDNLKNWDKDEYNKT